MPVLLALLTPAAVAQGLLEPSPPPIPPPAGIIDGDPATIDDWPMAGAMLVSGVSTFDGLDPVERRALLCSSTLIAPDVVLVAAHCVDAAVLRQAAEVDELQLDAYDDVRLAFSREQDLSRFELSDTVDGTLPEWPADLTFATSWVQHPDFSPYDLELGLGANADIALMFLEGALEDVPLAVLPTAEEGALLALGDEAQIVGWGRQDEDSDPGEYGEKRTATSFVAALGDYEMEIGEDGSDPRKCFGADSGGPTFTPLGPAGAWRLAGLSSHAWDEDECDDAGGVDTRVDPHLEWIDEQMRAACDGGTRVWCDVAGVLPPPVVEQPTWIGPFVEAHAVPAGGAPGGCSATGLTPSLAACLAGLAVVRRRRPA